MQELIKLQLKLDNQTHELTVEQVKELYDTLGDLLGIRTKERDCLRQLAELVEMEKTRQRHPVFIPQPYPVPFYPQPRPYWDITYLKDVPNTVCIKSNTGDLT